MKASEYLAEYREYTNNIKERISEAISKKMEEKGKSQINFQGSEMMLVYKDYKMKTLIGGDDGIGIFSINKKGSKMYFTGRSVEVDTLIKILEFVEKI